MFKKKPAAQTMSNEIMTVDLHCHPNLKSFNSGHPQPGKNMWEKIYHLIDSKFAKSVTEISQHVLKESQTNLESLAEGNIRVFQISLYPIERGFLHMRNLPQFIIGKRRTDILLAVVTGYSTESVTHLKSHYNYFEDLEKEYAYVHAQQGKSKDGKSEFILVNNFTELQEALQTKNKLVGIITIEGAHVLGGGTPHADTLSADEFKKLLTDNILAIKRWEYPPFQINLAHHFWNNLSGHATSFKNPINKLVNQNKGKDKGITEAGWHVIRQFLSTENGKRILVDVKHMSLQARKEYYSFITNYNQINPADTIPIICSHAGVNGFATMDSSAKDNDVMAKAQTHRFYRWSINLSNEEIKIIHQSGGLIGLMMDRGMLGGLDLVKKITEITDSKKQREEYCKLFWDNAFQMVKAIGEKNAWDVVAIGTDFDGTITHMEPYKSSAKFPLFQQDLLDYLEENNYQKELWYDYTPLQILEKIMHGNAMAFYKRFFV